MTRLAYLLLGAVLCRFYFVDGMAIGDLAAPAVEYIKAGIFNAILCAVIGLYIVFPQKASPAKFLAVFALGIGIVESLMMSGCRLAWHLQGYQISDLPKGTPLCSAATGLPVREVAFTLYFFYLIYEICQCSKARST